MLLVTAISEMTEAKANSAASATGNSIADNNWNAFVAASPYGDVLQCRDWGQVKQPEWQPIPVEVRDGGRLEATALVLRRALPLGRSVFYVPRGPIVDWTRPELVRAIVGKLRGAARQHKAVMIKIDPAVPKQTPGVAAMLRELDFMPSVEANNSFGGTQPRCVMKLDISAPLEEVMNTFHKKWSYNIRLSERKGVEVRMSESRFDLDVFYELYRTTGQRDGFVGWPRPYFDKLWDTLIEPGLARLFLTYHEGKALSGAISFLLPPQCWYVFGASGNEGRNLMPNHAMQWAMIRWAKEHGCTVYDFRGVHDIKPNEDGTMPSMMDSPDGLVRFKAGFGAEVVEYIGEWDLPLDRSGYWLWTSARPRATATLRGLKNKIRK
jgi:lipid II:glycine glycyltransferase (peptidoglycan interpeptide bridge formation enzyme)